MPSTCRVCGEQRGKNKFTKAEFKRADGHGRCRDCVPPAVPADDVPVPACAVDNAVHGLGEVSVGQDARLSGHAWPDLREPNAVATSTGDTLAADNGRCGFKVLGKLEPHAAALFRCAISSYLDEIKINGADTMGLICDYDEEEDSLWSRCSLHLRLHLLADLAEGLLVDSAPLPAETLLHYAAFVAMHFFVLSSVEMEIESDEDEREWSASAAGAFDVSAAEHHIKEMELTGAAATSADYKKDRANKKANKKLEKMCDADLTELAQEGADKASVNFDQERERLQRAIPKDMREHMRLAMAGGSASAGTMLTAMKRADMLRPFVDPDSDSVKFEHHRWRSRLYNAMLEAGIGAMTPMYDCRDYDSWWTIARIFDGFWSPDVVSGAGVSKADQKIVRHRVGRNELAQNRRLGPNKAVRARNVIVLRLAREENATFEDAWTPATSACDARIVMALADRHGLTHSRPANDPTICSVVAQLKAEIPRTEPATEREAESNEDDQRTEPETEREAESNEDDARVARHWRRQLRQMEALLWSDRYHEALQGQYGAPRAQVAAARASSTAEHVVVPGPNDRDGSVLLRQSPAQWRYIRIAERAQLRCSFRACATIGSGRAAVGPIPAGVLALIGLPPGSTLPMPRLLKCGRCKVTRYCTEMCQRAHWKTGHKEECAKLAALAAEQ